MDEAVLRQQLCQAAQQLWMRGLVAGDGGLLSVECHRRRYLVTPAGIRRSNLQSGEPFVIDVGGVSLNGEADIDPCHWLPHRLAYQNETVDIAGQRPITIRATIAATPPMVMALIRVRPGGQALELPSAITVPVVAPDDQPLLRAALKTAPVVALVSAGVISVAADLPSALSAIERVEHAATIEIACDHHGQP
ncbi:MAG: class II aldolase/adducin family protein [Phycisphaeraceae bacterium]